MKKLRLLNTSEYRTEQTLRKVLEGTRFRVFAQLPLDKVIRPEPGETVSRGEKSLLGDSELDFVIYDEVSEPQFAIEFDGPAHQYEDQKRRDLRKNRLCQRAGLPLLRITDTHLEEYEKASILEYIVGRFVWWDEEIEGILAEINEYVSEISEEELARLTEGGIADPTIDPTFIFGLRHPFPGTVGIAERLFGTFRIITPHLLGNIWNEAVAESRVLEFSHYRDSHKPEGHDYTLTRDYELIERVRNAEQTKVNRLHTVQVSFGIQWTLPIVEDFNWKEAPIYYAARTGNFPIAYQDIPGISMPELVENVCEFLALRQIEMWAKEHLSNISGAG